VLAAPGAIPCHDVPGAGPDAVSRKLEQVESAIARVVAEVLRDLKDPRMPLLTSVERVRVSPDLGRARVLVSSFGGDDASTLRALDAARGYIQAELGRSLRMRRLPLLSFHTDPGEVL
jgi:ribosome-binding factor A